MGSRSFLMRVGAAKICSPLGELRLLVDVDDFEIVASLETLVADGMPTGTQTTARSSSFSERTS
jgi:hypothetical protein